MMCVKMALRAMDGCNDAHKLGGGGRGLLLHFEGGLAGEACPMAIPRSSSKRTRCAQGTLKRKSSKQCKRSCGVARACAATAA
jgi:hypothetical protein